jgi:hypothetical protein
MTQWRRAILAAVSIASPPPEARNTRASSTGASAASRSASSPAGRLPKSPNVEYASSLRICAATASAISPRPWPMFAYQRLAVASR